MMNPILMRVFETRKLEHARRAAAMLNDARIPYTFTRLIDGLEVEIPHDAADMPAVWWLLKVESDRADEAKALLALIAAEVGGKPRATWPSMLYVVALFAMIATFAVRSCG
jgi:hypothetical protein